LGAWHLRWGGELVKKRGKYFYLFFCMILILSFTLSGCGKKAAVVKESALAVSVTGARMQDIAQNVSYPGIVHGKNEVNIMPKVSARVTAIYLQPGDQVKTGQTIMTLDSSDFNAAIRQAQAAVEQAEAGKRVNEVQLEAARTNYERMQKLFESGAISSSALESAKSAYDSLNAGTSDAAVASARAGLATAQEALDKCNITSPINGVLGAVNLNLGDVASPLIVAAIVTDSAALEIEVMVNENDVSYIKEGSQVDILINAAGTAKIQGKVQSVATVADPSKRNFAVKVALPNQDGKIRSGMFAELTIDTVSKQNVLCLPVNAVIPKGGSAMVYTVDKSQKARPLDVKTGIKNDSYIEITQGLKAGQQVITKGNTLVSDGTLVRVVAGGGK
jgi:RND family efflux transporter MFP subunit